MNKKAQLFVLAFLCLSSAIGQVIINEGDLKINLYEGILTMEAVSISATKLTVPKPQSFKILLSTTADQPISGFISLDKKYMKATKWYINGILIDENASEIPIQIDKTLIEVRFDLAELDKLNPKGFDLYFIEEFQFWETDKLNLITQSFFIGIFLFLSIFNLILFSTTRWTVYYKYAIYILLAALYFLYYFGFLCEIVPATCNAPINLVGSFYSLIFVAYFIFILELGNYKITVPKAAFFLRLGIIYKTAHVVLEILLFGFLNEIMFTMGYKFIFLAFEIILIILIIYHIIQAKSLRGKIVIYGSTILIISAILAQLNLGVNRAYLLETGVLFELLIFSVSLGYISRRDYLEKLKNQQLYVQQLELNRNIHTEIEAELEEKVKDRTVELLAEKSIVEQKNKENETLLKEVHHRVKNNLQMIISLLNMQQRRLESDAAKNALTLTKNRVKSIGLIHEHLYKHEDFSKIDLYEYVWELTHMIVDSTISNPKKPKPKITFEIPKRSADIDTAIPIGIILNELITNCVKYAFDDHDNPLVTIRIEELYDELIVKVSDNGYGTGNKEIKSGFGHTIVNTLVQNLSGSIHNESTKDGYVATIKLKEYNLF